MTSQAQTVTADGARSPAAVKVWDPFVRIFHWTLVVLVAILFVTGDELFRAHVLAGYTVIGLVGARVAWGGVGPRHARFSDFVRPPRETLRYIADVVRSRPQRHIGHNPIGGLMIVALLVSLSGLAASGYMMTTVAFHGADWLEDVHEDLASLLLALISLHVLGVLVTSLLHGENLVRAMITGRKRPS